MARTAIKKTKLMLLVKSFTVQRSPVAANERWMSKSIELNPRRSTKDQDSTSSNEQRERTGDPPATWVPHPRSGIYFPIGEEHVMDDIPNHTTSLDQTFWFRNTDGVDYDKVPD